MDEYPRVRSVGACWGIYSVADYPMRYSLSERLILTALSSPATVLGIIVQIHPLPRKLGLLSVADAVCVS